MAGFELNPVAPSDKGKCQEVLLCRIILSRTLTRYLFFFNHRSSGRLSGRTTRPLHRHSSSLLMASTAKSVNPDRGRKASKRGSFPKRTIVPGWNVRPKGVFAHFCVFPLIVLFPCSSLGIFSRFRVTFTVFGDAAVFVGRVLRGAIGSRIFRSSDVRHRSETLSHIYFGHYI